MEIIVKENRQLIIKDAENTQNENDIQNIKLIVPPQYEDFDKKIAFVTEEGVKWGLVENNMYKLERSITKFENVLIYVWLTKDNQDFRSVEEALTFNKNHKVDGEITPEERSSMEEAIAVLESEISKVEHMDIDAEKTGNTTTVTITDKEGNQKTVDISDGENGTDGIDGENGFSPTIRTIETTDGYDLEITDISGTNTITISNGKDGKDGKDGSDGLPGQAGADGISPTITETQTASGYDISITDKNGTRVISLLNGSDGRDGNDGAKGEKGDPGTNGTNGQDGYTPVKGIDYYTPTEKNEIEADVANRVSSMIPDVSNFITASVNNLVNYYLKSDTYNKTEVNNLISATKTGMFRTASTLPTPSIDTLNIIYLVPSEDPQTRNVKDEYITIEVNNGYDWEKIGSTAIDLTGYATESWVNTQISDFLTDTEIQQLINTAVKGKYTKPSGGIPKTDLANDVQISLDNSKTVNGHTVESNVPANAQFTDTIYDDSYIKENIQTNATNIANNTKNIAKKANSTINNNVDVLETTKSTESIGDNQLFFNKGAIFGGSAMDAGLVTRGICGISIPDSKGGCTKENLYVNYDGKPDYKVDRQLVIQAGYVGTHYGNNLYQFAAARGDAVKGYVDMAISSAVKGKYTKPETGIPKTDLAGTVQTSLDKADTAIQSSNFVYDSTTQTLTITTV